MPIYEYSCPHCNAKFELFRPLTQLNKAAFCPLCHASAKRIFSSFASPSKDADGVSAPTGGSSPCNTCSAISCASCQR